MLAKQIAQARGLGQVQHRHKTCRADQVQVIENRADLLRGFHLRGDPCSVIESLGGNSDSPAQEAVARIGRGAPRFAPGWCRLNRNTWGVTYNFTPVDREQLLLMPPSVAEWLPEDHLAWFVIDVVAELDTSAFLAAYRLDGRGGAAYDPQMMLARLERSPTA